MGTTTPPSTWRVRRPGADDVAAADLVPILLDAAVDGVGGIYAEAPAGEGPDDRLCLLSPAPEDAVDRLTQAVSALGPPS